MPLCSVRRYKMLYGIICDTGLRGVRGLRVSAHVLTALRAVGGVPAKAVGASRLLASLIFSLEALSTAVFLVSLAPGLPARWLSSLFGLVCITVSMSLHWRCGVLTPPMRLARTSFCCCTVLWAACFVSALLAVDDTDPPAVGVGEAGGPRR